MKRLLCISFLLAGCSQSPLAEPTEVPIPPAIIEVAPTSEAVAIAPDAQWQIPILMFHHIEDVPADHPDQVFYGLSFAPDSLESFLQYFTEKEIETLTFGDLSAIETGKRGMPEKAVMLTFDDGYTNNFNMARPLLEQYNMKGNFGIISQKIGESGFYMNAEQVQKLAETQHICSHTVTHPNLTELSDKALKLELVDSQAQLQELTGQDVKCLIYPAGRHDDRVIESALVMYDWARTTQNGKSFSLENRFAMPTVRIFPNTGLASLRIWFP